METVEKTSHDLDLLTHITDDPDATQATLAELLGVAVGTVNWHLKRLVAKGYVKVRRAQRHKLRYIITPEGIALRARLTLQYIENSFSLYRQTRTQVLNLLAQARQMGFQGLRLEGEGDVAEVCRLTCLEQGIEIVQDGNSPILQVHGLHVKLIFEATNGGE
jgi:DNA-binding MarR family transcriptional regulator